MQFCEETCEVDFGNVFIGKTFKKTISPPKKIKLLSVTHFKKDNPLFFFFDAKLSEDKKRIHTTFFPNISGHYFCNYFTVSYIDKTTFCLVLRGTTEEVLVEIHPSSVNFISVTGRKNARYLKLTNRSNTLALFNFTGSNGTFAVEPPQGRVKPKEYIWIKVFFEPRRPCLVYKEIYCLIQNHSPIVVNIKGACCKHRNTDINQQITFLQHIWRGENDYEQIFRHGGARTLIPVDISPENLDLGCARCNDIENNKTYAFFSVKSNSPVKILINWRQFLPGPFEISPPLAILSPGGKTEFQVTFCPMTCDKFYHEVVDADLQWGENYSYTLPFYFSINLLGHSFDENLCGWSPEYTITPAVVKMPPTTPNKKVYSQFLIKNLAHVPLMFRITPKKSSQFEIWPMQGVIEDFQICVIGMNAIKLAHISIREKWEIKFNTSFRTTIELLGTVEIPLINFFNGQTLTFTPTYLNCYNNSFIWFNNPTRLSFRYDVELKNFEKCLIKKQVAPNIIHGNELVPLNLTFCPKSIGEYKTSIFLVLYYKTACGERINARYLIEVIGTGVAPSFTVFPEQISFEDILCGMTAYNSMSIINNTSPRAYLTLWSRYEIAAIHLNTIEKTTTITPSKFSLEKSEQIKILFSIFSEEVGYDKIDIFATMHRSENDPTVAQQFKLAEIIYTVVFPFFKIVGLNFLRTTSVTSKYFTWRAMDIKSLNRALANLGYRNNITTYSKLPEGEYKARSTVFEIHMQNIGVVPSTFSITPLSPCDCKHANCKICGEIKFIIKNHMVEVNETVTFELHIGYNVLNISKYKFILNIGVEGKSNMGKIVLEMERFVIPLNQQSGDVPLPSVNDVINYPLNPVCIGDRNPPFQAVWIYSNTRAESHYSLKVQGKDKKYFILTSSHGIIKAKSSCPILLKFIPNELRKYEVTILVDIGSKHFVVQVNGYGILSGITNIFSQYEMKFLYPPNYPAIVTTNHLVVDTFSTHSFKKVFIGLKNMIDKTVHFDFSKFIIGGLVSVSVEPCRGELDPGEIIACQICVRSYSYPLQLTFCLFCKFTLPDVIEKWLDQRKKFSKIAKTFDNSFVITDSLRSPSEPSILELKAEPEPYYFDVNVNINIVIPNDTIKTDFPSLTLSGRYQISEVVTITPVLKTVVTSVINRILWELLESDNFMKSIVCCKASSYYEDYVNQMDIIQQVVHYPMRCFTSFIDDTLYNLMCDLFRINPYSDTDNNVLYPTDKIKAKTKCALFKLINNEYFRNILKESNTKYSLYGSKYHSSSEIFKIYRHRRYKLTNTTEI